MTTMWKKGRFVHPSLASRITFLLVSLIAAPPLDEGGNIFFVNRIITWRFNKIQN